MRIEPYLFLEGRCEEAIEFYTRALGAKVEMLMHFKDSPEPAQCGEGGAPPPADKVMHASIQIGETRVMLSDGMCSGKPSFSGVSLSITAKDVPEAERLFNALSDGGQVQAPFGKTFFSPGFGMVADRFGVGWMVVVMQA
jgi:PhnB protein